MNIEKCNCEGYADPTVYEALKNIVREERPITRFRPLVYICSPYAGDIRENVENARRFCRYAVSCGYIPLAPHLFFPQFMWDDDDLERELALHMNLVLLSKCRELWVFGDSPTKGMRFEIEHAKQKRMPIRYFPTDLLEVVK